MTDDPKRPAAPGPAPQPAASPQAPGAVRAEKAKAAHQGRDVFSTASLDPEAHKELVDLKASLAQETAPRTKRGQQFSWKKFVKLFR